MAEESPGILSQRRWSLMDTRFGRAVLKPLASLKLTVILFALAIFLVFAGTLAQVEEDNYTVTGKYFRSWFVLIPVSIFFPRSVDVPGEIPFPGGWIIGGLLLINLLAAHAIRFKLSWSRLDIFLIHFGLILLLISELVAGLFQVEGNLYLYTGRSTNYLEHTTECELAVIDSSDPESDQVTVVPGSMIRRGRLIQHASLPFDVHVDEYFENSNPMDAQTITSNRATAGEGLKIAAMAARKVSGVSGQVNQPAAYVTLRKKGSDESLGTYLVAVWLHQPQGVILDGKRYDLFLRFKRTYKPYSVHLLEARHDVYLGTTIPKNFSSRVRLVDPTRNVDREFLIYMNHPLRYAGETFYQYQMLAANGGSVLQVVRNPGWLLPYVSCALVAFGLAFRFLLRLAKFLRGRAAA